MTYLFTDYPNLEYLNYLMKCYVIKQIIVNV